MSVLEAGCSEEARWLAGPRAASRLTSCGVSVPSPGWKERQ
jgi:hypothetical protein